LLIILFVVILNRSKTSDYHHRSKRKKKERGQISQKRTTFCNESFVHKTPKREREGRYEQQQQQT
jgi:hypothetical protein